MAAALATSCSLSSRGPARSSRKQELLARVWPDTFVEEASIRVHVAALRRALGDGNAGRRYITNVPGRGYSFVAPVSVSQEQRGRPGAVSGDRASGSRTYRSRSRAWSAVRTWSPALAEQLSQHRFITIVGPGGIGKTTVALAVANRVLRNFPDGVHFVDFAPLTDPQLVPSTLAARLGVGVHAENPLPGLIAFLQREKHPDRAR